MKKIFSSNMNIDKNAYMNYRTDGETHINNMVTLAEGFMCSSLSLAEQLINNNKLSQADILIYPILFNANHAIELYLKAISWTLNLLNSSKEKFIRNHQLKDLLNDAKKLINNYETNTNGSSHFNEAIKPLESYIDELYEKIEEVIKDGKKKYNIDFSRYPLDYNGEPQFYIIELDNVVIDLENFHTVFKNIHKTLDETVNHYLFTVADKWEWEAEGI